MRDAPRKRILVTGDVGFLGSRFCEGLLADGHDVLCLDHFFSGTKDNIAHLLGHRDSEMLRHDVTLPLYVRAWEPAIMFKIAHGLRSMVLRYFNAAGADPAGEIGEDHDPETHLIPLAIAAAQGRGPELAIFGTDDPTADGTAVRDSIHVSDLAAAHVLALEDLLAGGASAALNLGTGRGWSVREVVAAVASVAGRAVPVREAPRRAGDPPVLVADPTRAMARLGWRAGQSDLETMVGTAWRWAEGR